MRGSRKVGARLSRVVGHLPMLHPLVVLALCLGAVSAVYAAVSSTPPFFGLDAASNLLILAPARTITLDAAAVVLPGGVDLLRKVAEQDDALSSLRATVVLQNETLSALRATVALLNTTLQAVGAANTALQDRLAQLEARVTGLSTALAAQQQNTSVLVNATVISLLSSPASVEAFRGPAGLVGSPGAQGPTGPAGMQGAPGPQGGVGPTGVQGVAGAQGSVGPIGMAGVPGVAGAQGPTGPAGMQGAPGPQGGVGPTGPSPGWSVADVVPSMPTSCADVLARNASATSGLYNLYPNILGLDISGSMPTWCEMRSGTAWTLLLKVDGAKPTFSYASSLWFSTATLNGPVAANLGQPASLNTEYKSVLFSYLPFTRLLLGMRDTNESYSQTRWAIMSGAMRGSLRDVLAVNATSVYTASRADFLNMAGPTAVLQPNCNLMGINAVPQPSGSPYYSFTSSVRIGIVANEHIDCTSPDTFIGFGGIYSFNAAIDLACGNYPWQSNQLQLQYPKFGYVFAA